MQAKIVPKIIHKNWNQIQPIIIIFTQNIISPFIRVYTCIAFFIII